MPEEMDLNIDGNDIINEPLKRSPEFMERYRQWLYSIEKDDLIRELKSYYDSALLAPDLSGSNCFIYNSSQSSGFYFPWSVDYPAETFAFVFDYFKDKILVQDYQLYFSNRQYSSQGDRVEVIEKHYLKPTSREKSKIPFEQKFGNIQIEQIIYNNRPALIKLMANVYAGRNYKNPLPFSDLTDILFN